MNYSYLKEVRAQFEVKNHNSDTYTKMCLMETKDSGLAEQKEEPFYVGKLWLFFEYFLPLHVPIFPWKETSRFCHRKVVIH